MNMKLIRWLLAIIVSAAIWSVLFYFLSPGQLGLLPSTGLANFTVNCLTSLIVALVLRRLLVGPIWKRWWLPLISIPLGAVVWGVLTSAAFVWVTMHRRDGGIVDYHNLSKFPMLAVFMAMTYYLIATYPLAYLNQLIVGSVISSNQSTDPTLASGTPLSGPESRHP
jgi:hypothetical protein